MGFLEVEELGEVLGFPGRGRGRSLLGVGSICFGVTFWFFLRLRVPAGDFAVPMAAVFSVLPLGYIIAYMLRVVQVGASGRADPPDWPDWQGVYDSAMRPLLTSLALLGIAFGPGVVSLAVILSEGWPLALPLVVVLALAGIYIAPMTLVVYTFFQTLSVATSLGFVFEQIGKIRPSYTRAVLFLVALGVSQAAAGTLIFLTLWPMPVVGDLLSFVSWAFVALYGGMVACYLLGQLYARHEDTLGWTQTGDDDPPPDRIEEDRPEAVRVDAGPEISDNRVLPRTTDSPV